VERIPALGIAIRESERFTETVLFEVTQCEMRAVLERRIRILFINHTAKLGGGELALCALIRHIDKDKVSHQVLLCADGPLVGRLKNITDVHIVPLSEEIREARKDGLGSGGLAQLKKMSSLPAYILRLRNEICRLKVDVVHTNSLKADILGGIAARLAGKRVIWHVRDRIESDYLPAKVARVFRMLARLVPHAIIANSRATLETLQLGDAAGEGRSAKGKWRGMARVVHDGFDFSEIASVPSAQRGSAKVGLIGRISPWKGQDIFLQAAATVHLRFPQVRFQIIGSALFGEHEYEAYVRKLRTDLQLEDCVEFLGFVNNVQECIDKLDIVVHASTVGEPFGQVIIEGMAARKPVIATRGGGIPEIVLDGESGLLVPMRDPTALAEAISTLLANPARAIAMGANGHQRVLDHFRIEKTAASVTDFYREVLT
jgi:glycosyltransferase involved in cell wall biosynthesis